MNKPQLIRWKLLAALFMAIVLLVPGGMKLTAATATPATLVGRRFALTETGGTSFMRFLANNRYELTTTNGVVETGYFTETRDGDAWKAVTTRLDGSLTTQYRFVFTSADSGEVTALVAGLPRRTGAFQSAEIPTAGLLELNVQHEISATGPSLFKIHFTGGTSGNFLIDLPGYGAGTFTFTPTNNAAKLFLTYTNADIAGDSDELNLEFRASSGSTIPSLLTGTNRVHGQVYPVRGTFTYTSVQ